MKFEMDVDIGKVAGDPAEELGRILRYRAGSPKHHPMEPGAGETVMDSAHSPVGTWRIGPAVG